MRSYKAIRITSTVLFFISLISPSPSPANEASIAFLNSIPTCANIPWGSNRTQVTNALATAGFTPDPQYTMPTIDGDQEYLGEILGQSTSIDEHFNIHQKLVATDVYVDASKGHVRSTFDAIHQNLVRKYGRPTSSSRRILASHIVSEADFEKAENEGLTGYEDVWQQPSGHTYGVAEYLTNGGETQIKYRSDDYQAEHLRRMFNSPDKNL